MKVELLSGTRTMRRQAELTALVIDAVEHGAAIGFARPVGEPEVNEYWKGVAAEVATGSKELLVALDERGHVVGSAQLAFDLPDHNPQRARVQKVLVKHAMRGRGIGAALMARLEQEAQAGGRTELFLDSSKGASGASIFCRRLGYTFMASARGDSTEGRGPSSDSAIFHKRLPVRGPAAPSDLRAPHALAG